MILSRLYDSGALKIDAIKCRPQMMGRNTPEHAAYGSFAFVRRGAFRLHQGATATVIDPLTALVFRAGDEYAVSHPFECGDDCVEFRLDEETLDEITPADGRNGCNSARIETLRIDQSLSRRQHVLARRLELGLAQKLETEETAIALVRAALTGRRDGPASTRAERGRRKIEQAKELLLSDLAHDWSLAELAAELNISSYYLTRLFRRWQGIPLYRYLTEIRLAAALDRILCGQDSLTELAFDLGFSSHSHFSAAFRRRYGFSPSGARAQMTRSP